MKPETPLTADEIETIRRAGLRGLTAPELVEWAIAFSQESDTELATLRTQLEQYHAYEKEAVEGFVPLHLREAIKDCSEDVRRAVGVWHQKGTRVIGSYQMRLQQAEARETALQNQVEEHMKSCPL